MTTSDHDDHRPGPARGGTASGVWTPVRLQQTVDAYGGDPARWPRAARDAAPALLDRGPEARRVLAEARALDRLLDLAPAGAPEDSIAHRLLIDRIVATSATDQPDKPVSSPVVGRVAPARLAARAGMPGFAGRYAASGRAWQAAALLAASLLIGIYLGQAGVAVPGVSTGERVQVADLDHDGDSLLGGFPAGVTDGADEGIL